MNEWTGVTDLIIDPTNPDILYAATWQRHRNVAALLGGEARNLYLQKYGRWRYMGENKKGLPSANMGKIGLAISPMKSNVLYAAIELERKRSGLQNGKRGRKLE